ncbi:SCO4225 family membrane protein [Streptomyces sparsus]
MTQAPNAAPTRSTPRPSRFTPRSVLVNPVALGYLALVVGAALFAVADALFVDHESASFAGIWAVLATAPTVFLLLGVSEGLWELGEAPLWAYLLMVALSATAQAALLGACYRAFRGRPSAVDDGWHNPAHGDS